MILSNIFSWFFWGGLVGLQQPAVAYATLGDLVMRYGQQELTQLTDFIGAGAPSSDVANTALVDASTMIDGYIAGRYKVPVRPIPGNLRQICCAIARFLLWRDQASDAVKTLYTAAIAQLKDIQAGRITLEAEAVQSTLTGDAVQFTGGPRTFSRDALRGF